MDTVVGLFRDIDSAARAIEALKEAGFSQDSLSILAKEAVVPTERGRRGVDFENELDHETGAPLRSNEVETSGTENQAAHTIGAGAVGGGILGGLAGLLVGAGALVIPGIGPAIAAGVWSAALTGAAAGAGLGATAGGLVGALASLGFNNEEANALAEGVRRGGVVIVAHARPGRGDIARTIMNNAGAVDLHEQTATWRAGGWNRFDETQDPGELDDPSHWGPLQGKNK